MVRGWAFFAFLELWPHDQGRDGSAKRSSLRIASRRLTGCGGRDRTALLSHSVAPGHSPDLRSRAPRRRDGRGRSGPWLRQARRAALTGVWGGGGGRGRAGGPWSAGSCEVVVGPY